MGKKNRRELIRGVLRIVSLGAVAGGTGSVLARRRKLIKEGKCINKAAGCRDCAIVSKCNLPLGMSARKVLERQA
jgi:hypothetical protein